MDFPAIIILVDWFSICVFVSLSLFVSLPTFVGETHSSIYYPPIISQTQENKLVCVSSSWNIVVLTHSLLIKSSRLMGVAIIIGASTIANPAIESGEWIRGTRVKTRCHSTPMYVFLCPALAPIVCLYRYNFSLCRYVCSHLLLLFITICLIPLSLSSFS